MKSPLISYLVATTMLAAPAFAQTTIPPSGTTDRPAATAPSGATGSGAMSAPNASGPTTPAPSASSPPSASTAPASPSAAPGATATANPSGGAGGFITTQEQSQLLASKLIGTRVISQTDESIGDINDVLMDSSGRTIAVVVGVGGFLGIGEKNVAVPFEMLEFVQSDAVATTGSTATGTASTGSSPAGSAPATASGGARGITANPSRVMLKTTKAELQNAPAFKRYDARAGQSGGSNAPAATAPRQ